MLPGNKKRITTAIFGSQKAGNQKRFPVFLRPFLLKSGRKARKEITENPGRLCHIFLAVRSNNDGKNTTAKLAEPTPCKPRENGESPHSRSRYFLRARFYHSTKIRLSLILSYGNLVGVATPSPPFAACAA